MARKKSKKPKPPKINKTKLLDRLVEKPSQGIRVWAMREMTILGRLEEKFSLEFLNQLNFGKKLPSLAVLYSDYYMKELNRRFRAYNYVPPIQKKIELGEKCGEDFNGEKKQSLREILN